MSSSSGLLRRVLLNSGSNMAVMAVKLAITFIMTPIFVRNLGRYDYGIWELMTAVIGYAGLLDLGVRITVSRFIAKFNAENDRQALGITFSTSLAYYTILGLVILCVALWTAVFHPGWLAERGSLANDADKYRWFLVIVGLQALNSFPGFVAESVFDGLQKYYIKNTITIFNSILGFLALYFWMTSQNALLLLATVNATGVSVKYLIYFALLRYRAFGEFYPRKSDLSWTHFKELLAFGFKSFIQAISTRIETGTDTIVIAYFMGPAMVPFYSIPANLVSYLRLIGWNLTHVFMPLFSDLNARKQQSQLQSVYLNASRYTVGLLLPMGAGMILVGPAFIGMWIGRQYEMQAENIIVLLVAYTLTPMLNPFSSRYLTALGEHGVFARWSPVAAICNLVLSIIFVRYFGLVGAALGSVLPALFLLPLYLRICCRFLEIRLRDYIIQAILPAIPPTVLMTFAIVLLKRAVILSDYWHLALVVIFGLILYVVAFFFFSMRSSERVWLMRSIRHKLKAGI